MSNCTCYFMKCIHIEWPPGLHKVVVHDLRGHLENMIGYPRIYKVIGLVNYRICVINDRIYLDLQGHCLVFEGHNPCFEGCCPSI